MKLIIPFLCCLLFIACKKATLTPDNPIPTVAETHSLSAALDDSLSALSLLATSKKLVLEGEVITSNVSSKLTFASRSWQGIPSITISQGGVLYAAWYSGGKGEGPGNYITVAVSTDKGLSWKENVLIVNPTNAKVRFFDPALWTDKFGNVFLSWSKCRGALWDGIGGVWYMQIKYRTGGTIYSTPKWVADGVMLNKPAETYDNTGTMYPIAVWKLSNIQNNSNGIYVYRSKYIDSLKKSQGFAKISDIPFDRTLLTYDEHQVVQLKNGTYLALIRGTDGIYCATSKDLTSWRRATKFTGISATTSSRFFLGRLKSGKIALVINNNFTRTNLKIYLSDDEAKTWKYEMMLDNKLSVSYPDLTQGPDDRIYVVYDYDRFGKKDISMVSFTEKDVIENATSNIRQKLISGDL